MWGVAGSFVGAYSFWRACPCYLSQLAALAISGSTVVVAIAGIVGIV